MFNLIIKMKKGVKCLSDYEAIDKILSKKERTLVGNLLKRS